MTTSAYEEILQAAQRLPLGEQRRLRDHLTMILEGADGQPPPPRRSIRELRGLGKESWRQIDTTAYLRQERDAWDG